MDRRLIPAIAISPLRELARLENEIDRIFKELLPAEAKGELVSWSPRTDIYEKDNNIVIEAEIPGAKKEDIEVKIKDNAVVIKGEVKKEEEKKEENYYKKERFYGKFERVVPLPADVKVEEAKAEYQDGILKLTIPKAVEEKEVKIEIK